MIRLQNITLRRGAKVVLDAATCLIQPREKVALIGRNGAGKSSLFALLTGELHEDSGSFDFPSSWITEGRVAQVAQHLPETEQNASDFVVAGDARLQTALDHLSQTESCMNTLDAIQRGTALAEAHASVLDAGGADAKARAQSLLMGLGFRIDQLELPVNSFSGGWRMRLQLARALMSPSDLLLLDEPTNHLDLDALVWLESFLAKYTGTLLVISHDREFLDAVTQVTLHLHNGKLTRYGGNYSTFETLRAQALQSQDAAYKKQQEKIEHLQKFIDRFKAKATKAKQAQSRVKALERMTLIAPTLAEAQLTFEFTTPTQLPNPMLQLQNVCLGYRVDQPILQGVSRTILPQQRIGILGANGQGKSTLIKTIAGVLVPLSGTLVAGGRGKMRLSVGYFAQQELDILQVERSALEHMLTLVRTCEQQGLLQGQDTREQALYNYLGRFLFSGDMAKQAVGTMSGGEKARLVLAMIVWQRPNLLLLDEPTNHLDLSTREALAVALNEFEGTVMLVSHDRALLRSVCDEFWLVDKGKVNDFDGDLDDYQSYLLDVAKERRLALHALLKAEKHHKASQALETHTQHKHAVATSHNTTTQVLSKGKRAQLAKEMASLEYQLALLTTEKTKLETELGQTSDLTLITQISRRLGEIQQTIETHESRWLELTV